MSQMPDEQLLDLCRDTASAADDAVGWIERNREAIGPKFPMLRMDFRRRAMLARRYERSVRRPVGVGVFGASQTGKSYLVSALARQGLRPLTVLLDAEYDFLSQINPADDKEATGLVTRFTVRQTATPSGFPVRIQLLNQVDLIKILTNTYFLDFDATQEKVPSEAEIEAALSAAAARAGTAPVGPLEEVEIDDLRRYFMAQFSSRQTARVLNETGYWTRLETLAPRLKVEDRIKLYGFLWGHLDPFSTVYRQLYDVLETLDFPDACYCAIDALIPRETSIINVEALAGLGEASARRIQVHSAGGQIRTVESARLTAIVSELVMQIKDHPWEFLKHTDLLDFPGARSREMNYNAESYVKQPGKVADLFRRGKVAYLFDRYCDENELSSMLLCLQPSNQEVRTIPGLVATWIRALQGDTALARSKRETALFVIMTKFDKRFEEAEGKAEIDWTSVLKTPLGDFSGASADNWPLEWHPGKAFDNVFWLRNPNFKAPGLIKYAGKEEVGVVHPERLASVRQAYLANDHVRRHLRDPERAWDEAFRLNDGGISFLAGALAPVCRPELKRQQVAARIAEIRSDMVGALSEFHVSGDSSAEREKRVRAAQGAVKAMVPLIRNQRFGHLLDALQVRNEELQSLFRRLSLKGEVFTGTGPDVLALIEELGLTIDVEAQDQPAARDKYVDLAQAAMSHWAEGMLRLTQEDKKLKFFQIEPQAIEIVARELLAGAERVGLERALAAEMRAMAPAVETSAVATLKAAMAAAENINHYLYKLSQDRGGADRARKKNGQVVFRSKRETEGSFQLPENRGAFYQDFIGDWLAAFLFMVEKNAEGPLRSRFSPAETDALRTLVIALAA